LADIAQREAFRRQATQKSQASLTNLGVPPEAVPVSAVTVPPRDVPTPPAGEAPPASDPAARPATTASTPEGAKPAEAVRDEAWWRKRMADARALVDRGLLTAEALQTRINALQADAVNLDDPIKQTKARMDLVKALDELERVNKQVDDDRKAIAALQEEARRQNVPAGWLR
jgi:hypothetical protein